MAQPEVFALGRYEGGNALLESLIGSSGFIGKLLDPVFQALVCCTGLLSQVPYADAKFRDLALGIAPEHPGLLAILAPLLRYTGSDVFDAVEAFVASHDRPYSPSILAYPPIARCAKLLD
jgi:hypothetical protein